jgi:patatin-like phospholipase/acyl hydrolase
MKFRILSIDGGGIWGIVAATMLHRIEQLVGQPLHEYFHLIAGTSTGSIIAAGLSCGITPEHIANIYYEQGNRIFPYPELYSLQRIPVIFRYGPLGPKYAPDGLQQVLREQLGNRKLTDIGRLKLLITAYDTLSRHPVFFKSWRGRFINTNLWEACLASAAAPTYFPAHALTRTESGMVAAAGPDLIRFCENLDTDRYNQMRLTITGGKGCGQERQIIDLKRIKKIDTAFIDQPWQVIPDSTSSYSITIDYSLIDGGMGANNPTACAIAEALNLGYSLAEISVLSVGTGSFTQPISLQQGQRWGLLNWAGPISNVLMDASSDINDYIANQISKTGQYLRLQFRLDRQATIHISDKIDDVSPENLANLRQVANDYINQAETLDGLHEFINLARD